MGKREEGTRKANLSPLRTFLLGAWNLDALSCSICIRGDGGEVKKGNLLNWQRAIDISRDRQPSLGES